MKLIAGLGNYGKEYERTRHNAGFRVMDEIAMECHTEISQKKFQALISMIRIKGEQVLLMKPQTYMNNSGEAIGAAMRFYQIKSEDLLVIYDDIDLAVGKLRLREKGSAGGQNGMKSVIAHVGTDQIRRIRVGVGNDPLADRIGWVLGKIPQAQWEEHQASLILARDAALYSVTHTFQETMNRYNKR